MQRIYPNHISGINQSFSKTQLLVMVFKKNEINSCWFVHSWLICTAILNPINFFYVAVSASTFVVEVKK